MSSYSETHAFLSGLYASSAQGDIEPTLEAMSDDLIFEYVGPLDIYPFCGVRHGKAEMREAVASISAEFSIDSVSLERLLVDEKGYVAILAATATNRKTGIQMKCELVDVAKTGNGKIIELREYWDVEGVTKQLMGKRLTLAS